MSLKNNKILGKAIKTFGYQNQITIAMEELAELIQECSKLLRYNGKPRDNILLELCDVEICYYDGDSND